MLWTATQLARKTARALLACVACASAAHAVDVTGTSAGLAWSAASGPVAGYSVQVSRNGSAYREEQRVQSRSTRVSGSVGDTLRVRVAAFDGQGKQGPASTASDSISFVAVAPPPPPPPTPMPGGSTGDLNGDGLVDTVLFNAKMREVGVLLLQSDGSRVYQAIGTQGDTKSRPVGYADVDGDGQADVLWRNNVTGANEIWRLTGTTYSVLALPTRPVDWSCAAFRDFDGDGHADLLWYRGTTGESSLWKLGATGLVSETAVDPGPTGMRLGAVADVDGDGAPDLVWHDPKTDAVEAWRMNGAAPVAVIALPNAPNGGVASGAGDFDGDGVEDLVWRAGRVVRVWFMHGMQAPAQGIAITLSEERKLKGALDVDSNGHADLLTAKGKRFTAFAISPTGVPNAKGEMQWTYQAIALTAIPKSKAAWAFLVLQ